MIEAGGEAVHGWRRQQGPTNKSEREWENVGKAKGKCEGWQSVIVGVGVSVTGR